MERPHANTPMRSTTQTPGAGPVVRQQETRRDQHDHQQGRDRVAEDRVRAGARCAAGRNGHADAASEPAGVDVGDQDRPGADVPQVVHDPLGVALRGTIARTATQAGSRSGRDRRGLDARGQRDRGLDLVDRARRNPSSRSDGRPGRPAGGAATGRHAGSRPATPTRRTSTASERRIGSPITTRPAWRSVVPVSTTSAMTSATPSWMEVSTAPSSRITSALTPCSARCLATSPGKEVATRRPAEVLDAGVAGAGQRGVAEGRAAEAELEHLLGRGAGVQQQVAAGDADVQPAGTDVDGDVARAQEEELDAVVRVGEHELPRVRALAVAGLAEHGGGGLGQRALVRHGDAEHGTRPFQGWDRRLVRAAVISEVSVYVVERRGPVASMSTCRW